jgi:MOSC domain-containing protein YiiM
VSGIVLAVNVGRQVAVPWAGNQERTGIDKRPVSGPVPVGPRGLAGDEHGDPRHGGFDQAVYAYAEQDADFWSAELGRELWPGAFGENLTVTGVDASGAVSGERWQVGEVVLEVTVPRMPCVVFAGFWGDVPHLVRRFTEAGRPGAYLRVLATGAVGAGDRIEVLSRPEHGVTMSELMRARAGDRSLMPRVREIPELPQKWRSWLDSVEAVKVSD